jgi:hypothetical protein
VESNVPRGPLAARWLSLELGEVRAGAAATAVAEVENAGTAVWRSEGRYGIQAAYHWLDLRRNAIVWDGVRTALPAAVAPGERMRLVLTVRGPIPPGRYRLAFDLVDEGRSWFEEVGNTPHERELEVEPRIRRALAVRGGDPDALAAQEEPLVPEADANAIAYLAGGVAPAPDWSRRVLDAHQEGYAVVGGSITAPRSLLQRRRSALDPYAPGAGRQPRFAHPLVCPSVVRGVEPVWVGDVEGLPAARPPEGKPWLYDGRIALTARRRSGRRPG